MAWLMAHGMVVGLAVMGILQGLSVILHLAGASKAAALDDKLIAILAQAGVKADK